MSLLHLVPIRARDARGFVATRHRHHAPATGQVFAAGAADDSGVLRAVAVAGRPVARHFDDGSTLEATRTASDGSANSRVYGACWRAAKALGYHRLVTYTQDGESGTSLRGAGRRVIAHRRPRRAGTPPPARAHHEAPTTSPAPCGRRRDRVPEPDVAPAPIDHVTAHERAAAQDNLLRRACRSGARAGVGRTRRLLALVLPFRRPCPGRLRHHHLTAPFSYALPGVRVSPSSFSAVRPFGDLPVLRLGNQWLLTVGRGAVPADRPLAAELDRFAVAMAAANEAVAALNPPPRDR